MEALQPRNQSTVTLSIFIMLWWINVPSDSNTVDIWKGCKSCLFYSNYWETLQRRQTDENVNNTIHLLNRYAAAVGNGIPFLFVNCHLLEIVRDVIFSIYALFFVQFKHVIVAIKVKKYPWGSTRINQEAGRDFIINFMIKTGYAYRVALIKNGCARMYT